MSELATRWIRNKSDELAIKAGCEFDIDRAAYTVWWIEKYCRLYEGENAGEPVLMRCGNPELDVPILNDWDEGGRELSYQRCFDYCDWFDSKPSQVDWQYDCTMSVFGWVRFSKDRDRMIRRFNQSSVWIPKKQKKTPTIAAWSVYLTCGDGEKGGKTFGGAKDGTQARIAAEHAINMVEQSPLLSSECKVNQSEKMITHIPTRSFYKPLSSSDSRSKKSKEGINGNIAIDETHVVDREFIKIISRAGISRAEPLRFDFSTAGNNPDGYGKERQDYVRKVISGEIDNPNVFGRIYEAPQDATDEEIKADPIKYGKLANPAWGHTANKEEFLSDFNESKQSPSLFADFKMYRLNIWQTAENPWLRMDDWKKNAEEFKIEDFFGQPVWLGLDLSKTRDMTAISLIFKSTDDEPIFHQWPLFWLPEKYARENKDKCSFLDWADSGHLELVPGETVKLSYVKERMKWIDDNFDVIDLAYDKTYAYDLIDEYCEDQLRWNCAEFQQSVAMYAGPTENYEAMLVEGRLKHNDHPVLNWQAGHVQVKTNEKNGKIPCKPKRDDVKKIDGIVAGIMALHRAYHGEAYRAGQFYLEESNWVSG